MAEIDRSLVGSEEEPFTVEIEAGAIRRFAEAIGDTNPLYHDDDFARRQGYARIIAPPTFPVAFRAPREPRWSAELDRRRVLAGGQSFEYVAPIVAGMRLQCRTRFVGVEDKQGSKGSMELLHQETSGHDEEGALVFVHRRTMVYRAAEALAKVVT